MDDAVEVADAGPARGGADEVPVGEGGADEGDMYGIRPVSSLPGSPTPAVSMVYLVISR